MSSLYFPSLSDSLKLRIARWSVALFQNLDDV